MWSRVVGIVCLWNACGWMGLFAAEPPAERQPPAPVAEAAARMTLPEGFRASLFAGEPDVVQPIAMTWDDRGRLWVVECLSYPTWTPTPPGQDRVTIFTDRDGDGRFDERRVFWDQGHNLSGIELGFGGVWLCSTPNLVFVPDRDGDDVPDGPAEIRLDGWDLKAKHNVFNSLAWGPDGWLYGCNGILSNSRIGAPGTPDEQRTPMNCGVWRYHPLQQRFEVVAHGTTNPWGIDWDDQGGLFITNCVIQHLWHVTHGGHYTRMFGQDFNPHLYGLIESCADHIHWAGGAWQASRAGAEHSAAGGGHAHSGCMIYLGDNWPDEYRNNLFTLNIHGHRLNRDLLEPQGSGYVARHAADVIHANDTWFRGVAVKYGPDGAVWMADWSDDGECHDYTEQDIERGNGRIYRVAFGDLKWKDAAQFDLAQRTDAQLVQAHLLKNDWHVRHARRLLQERAAAGKLSPEAVQPLHALLQHADRSRRLRALWTLHATGLLDEATCRTLLADQDIVVRGWAVTLAFDQGTIAPTLQEAVLQLAASDRSPRVRLALASGVCRLPADERGAWIERLIQHDDGADPNLTQFLWYALEPWVAAAPEQALQRVTAPQIASLLRQRTARRVALADKLPELTATLAQPLSDKVTRDLLLGLREALSGRRNVTPPTAWGAAYQRISAKSTPETRRLAARAALVFGDAAVFRTLRSLAADTSQPDALREQAIEDLVEQRDAELVPVLQAALAEPALRGLAIRSLAAYDDPRTPELLLKRYAEWPVSEQQEALSTLASRPAYALALLTALEQKQIAREHLSAYTLRQLQGMKGDVASRLAEVWGAVQPQSVDKASRIAVLKGALTAERLAAADRAAGRLVYNRTCGACHRLFDAGRKVGPDLTGGQRRNLDYLLENLVDPNALIGRDYQMTVIQTTDGRVLNGLIAAEDAQSLTILTQNDTLTLPQTDVEAREQAKISLMPEGQIDRLTPDELRDLLGYLMGEVQVELPAAR